MKRVIITGARGFIGRHCLPELLAQDYEVHGVSTGAIGSDATGTTWHQVDLLNPNHVKNLFYNIKPSHLLHLAWFTKHKEYWTSEANLLWVQASLNILQNFAWQGGQRVVTAGTCAEYDWNYGFCSESITPLTSSTLYGTCKNSLQQIQTQFCKANGISSAWGRVFFLYGPYEYQDRIMPLIINSLLSNKIVRTTHGNQIRDFLYVQDVADALISLLNSEVTGAINIASGKPIILKELILKLGEILERSELIRMGAFPNSEQDPLFIVADVNRLSNELRWTPKFDLDDGLIQTINWWKKQLHLTSEVY